MRYENPLYMAEQAGAVDPISSGRLQLGVSRGSPEPARDGQHQFGYDLEPGNSWANETRERTALFRKAISGAGIAHPGDGGHYHQDGLLPINPISPGLENRIWWGAATIGSGLWTASVGMDLLSSTLLLEDDGRPFHVLQADQLRQYKAAYAASGHTTGGMTAVTRSAFPITTDKDELYFGRRERGDSVGFLDGSVAAPDPPTPAPGGRGATVHGRRGRDRSRLRARRPAEPARRGLQRPCHDRNREHRPGNRMEGRIRQSHRSFRCIIDS